MDTKTTSTSTDAKQWWSRRRLSFGSNVSSRQDVMMQAWKRPQQVISVQVFFEAEAPSIDKLRALARTLGAKFERMRGIPWDISGGGHSRVYKDVSDWEAALDILVQDKPLQKDTEDEARVMLEQLKLRDMNTTTETGVEVPLWRIYRVGSKSIVLTIDHALGDGLSLATLLAVVGFKDPDSTQPLSLKEVSPLFPTICNSSAWQRFVFRWGFLWPPNFLRCIKILRTMMADPPDPMTPLMPTNMEEIIQTKNVQKIPANVYGTIYLCPLPVSLFKSLAKADGKDMTINDVLAASIGDMVRRYLQTVGYKGKGPIRYTTPLAVPVKNPSKYLDDSEGMCQAYCPISHQLPLLGDDTDAKTRSFRAFLHQTHERFQLVKTSFVASLFFALISLMGKFVNPANMADEFQNGIGKSTYVWSNVPGPALPVYISGRKVTELQCLVSNPFSMMQTCSYNGTVYSSIQVDVRTATRSETLAEAYVETLKAAISELLMGQEKENALWTLKEAVSKHKPGPYLSRESY